ncbi:Biotinyl protein ligase (BPL) and lipoyl protein ligase (LPL) catalytic domain [Trinorchestia longiramus]|nr:Biotinyl protein ligase (BPL) and lipoyl protein ligase (LPL) catalytic domain [Trinorchestia longiramus]
MASLQAACLSLSCSHSLLKFKTSPKFSNCIAGIRHFVTTSNNTGIKGASKASNKVVFISQSTDVFSNLALETWLYSRWSFESKRLLFLYRNAPCVVIGRHQNPFVEANLAYLESAHVPVVRRQSGGGTVYHDLGNLNCCFFTERKSYNRRWNLDLMSRTLQSNFGLPVTVNSRDDLMLNEKLKVSGSAAKLGSTTAYHHCTLLVNSDRLQLSLALKGDKTLETTATASVPSSVGNLSDGGQKGVLTVEKVIDAFAWAFLDAPLPGEEDYTRGASCGITLVNPQDDWFPGLGRLRAELMSWEWLYEKTPRFSKTLELPVPEYLSCFAKRVRVTIKCQRGVIEELSLDTNAGLHAHALKDLKYFYECELLSSLRGTPYTSQLGGMLYNTVLAWRAPANAGQPVQL